MIAEAAPLFALPPSEFVSERNKLTKSLKSDGRLEESKMVAALKRPKLSAYALNRLAHEHRAIVERLVDAIEAASTAQSAAIGGQAAGLREATTELRAATNSAVDGAVQVLNGDGANGEGQRDEIVSLIREFVGHGNTTALHNGVIGSADNADPDGESDFFRGAPNPPVRKYAQPSAQDSRQLKSGKPAKRLPPPQIGPSPADRARKIQLERQVGDAANQVERAERKVAEALEKVREAQEMLDDRTAVLAARQKLMAAAERELATFRTTLSER